MFDYFSLHIQWGRAVLYDVVYVGVDSKTGGGREYEIYNVLKDLAVYLALFLCYNYSGQCWWQTAILTHWYTGSGVQTKN